MSDYVVTNGVDMVFEWSGAAMSLDEVIKLWGTYDNDREAQLEPGVSFDGGETWYYYDDLKVSAVIGSTPVANK